MAVLKVAPPLTRKRLEEILERVPRLRIVVVGDYFLDKYLIIDPTLSEVSLETGLEARQVVDIRCSPGAAGTVMNNLSTLRVGQLKAVGIIGDDGEGYELVRELKRAGVCTEGLIKTPSRRTPTYTKPMRRQNGAEVEMERLDIKNRAPTPKNLQAMVIGYVMHAIESLGFDAVIIADQVQEANCGVITDEVRDALQDLSQYHPRKVFFADSRVRIHLFRHVMVKPNRHEAAAAMGHVTDTPPPLETLAEFGTELARRNERPVFITLGGEGIMACSAERAWHSPALPLRGPIDIVGAGDSASAGVVCALCAGATLAEAAAVGNLCASVTIHKLGTTGTASPQELLRLVS